MAIDPEKFKIDPKKASSKEVEEALALLEKKRVREAKIKAGEIKGSQGRNWAEMTPEQKGKARSYNRRRNARQALMVAFAESKGYTPSDKEIDAYITKAKVV